MTGLSQKMIVRIRMNNHESLIGQRHFRMESVAFLGQGPNRLPSPGEAPGNGYPNNQRANGPIIHQTARPLALQ